MWKQINQCLPTSLLARWSTNLLLLSILPSSSSARTTNFKSSTMFNVGRLGDEKSSWHEVRQVVSFLYSV